jgi:hypothetical protein
MRPTVQFDPVDPYAEPNQVFRGSGTGRFEEVLPRGGTAVSAVHTSRAAALGDLDNDGGVDVVVVNKDARPYVLRNRVSGRGHWIMLRLVNVRGCDALGAEVSIAAGQVVRRRFLQPSYGYCSSSDPRLHCGLGSAVQVDSVTVDWPGGRSETFGPLASGQLHVLHEGTGRLP